MYGEKQDLLFNTFTLNFSSLIESNYVPSFFFPYRWFGQSAHFSEQLLYSSYAVLGHFPRGTQWQEISDYTFRMFCLLPSVLCSALPHPQWSNRYLFNWGCPDRRLREPKFTRTKAKPWEKSDCEWAIFKCAIFFSKKYIKHVLYFGY